MVFALLDSDLGFEGLLGLFVFQPIIAMVLSFSTIIICLIIGLPIRLNNKLNNWWATHFYVSIIGIIIGMTLLVLAFLPTFGKTVSFAFDGVSTLKQVPNTLLSITGWFLTAFSLLHVYPPRRLTEKIKSIFQKTLKVSMVVLISFTMTCCGNSNRLIEKPILLKADREAPLGWVYLTIYEDSTFEFKLTGIRGDDDIYKGKVTIGKDSLFFAYSDSMPRAGKTAIYNDKVVAYVDGAYPERVNIMTKTNN